VLTKPELALLNIVAGIAKDGWKRPLQFSCGFAGGDDYNGLEEYMIMQGLTNKLVPIRVMGSSPDVGAPQQVSLDKSLDLYLNHFLWGGTDRKDIYFDEKNKSMIMTYRFSGAKVAEALIRKNRKEDAVKLLDKITEMITYESYQYDQSMWSILSTYYLAGAKDKARRIGDLIARDSERMMNYVMSLNENARDLALQVDSRTIVGSLQFIAQAATQAGDTEKAEQWNKTLMSITQRVGPPSR
jgi:hypothetical protein